MRPSRLLRGDVAHLVNKARYDRIVDDAARITAWRVRCFMP